MKSDTSLKGKIKALARQSGLKPQQLLQMYMFEHLPMRLEKSDYAETFVLKGGLPISSMTGISQRTTMDMDATVVGMDMDEATVSRAVTAICAAAPFERWPATKPCSRKLEAPPSCKGFGLRTSPPRLTQPGSISKRRSIPH